jgi:predicted nucleic acid-binding protein
VAYFETAVADALLDTTFFIDYHRGDAKARDLWLQIHEGTLSASFSSVTVFELWVGTLTRQEEVVYRALLMMMEEAPLTSAEAELAATWLRALSPQVSETVIRDAFIAATGERRGEPIYTRNVRDFTRFYSDVRSY